MTPLWADLDIIFRDIIIYSEIHLMTSLECWWSPCVDLRGIKFCPEVEKMYFWKEGIMKWWRVLDKIEMIERRKCGERKHVCVVWFAFWRPHFSPHHPHAMELTMSHSHLLFWDLYFSCTCMPHFLFFMHREREEKMKD